MIVPTTFRIAPNRERPGEVVEVLKNGVVCAVIYPDDGQSDIKIVSAHFAGVLATGSNFPKGVTMDNGSRFLPIPTVQMTFDPRPYEIIPGQITIKRKPQEST